jgi:hypothetical protein
MLRPGKWLGPRSDEIYLRRNTKASTTQYKDLTHSVVSLVPFHPRVWPNFLFRAIRWTFARIPSMWDGNITTRNSEHKRFEALYRCSASESFGAGPLRRHSICFNTPNHNWRAVSVRIEAIAIILKATRILCSAHITALARRTAPNRVITHIYVRQAFAHSIITSFVMHRQGQVTHAHHSTIGWRTEWGPCRLPRLRDGHEHRRGKAWKEETFTTWITGWLAVSLCTMTLFLNYALYPQKLALTSSSSGTEVTELLFT